MSDVEPGWYPDPTGGDLERRWDGRGWTEETRPPRTPDPVPDAPRGRPILPLAVAGIVAVAAVGTGAFLLASSGTAAPDADAAAADDVADGATAEDPPAPSDTDGTAAEPAQDADLLDLREVDWTAVEWTTDCSGTDGTTTVQLSDGPGRVFEGWLEHDPDPASETPWDVYGAGTSEAIYGDVTGNGRADMVVPTQCFLGNDFVTYLEVWTHDAEGEPLHLPPVLTLTKFDGYVDDFEVVDGRLRVTTHEAEPHETHPHLEGYGLEVVTDWWFEDHRWRADEHRREPRGDAATDTRDVRAEGFQLPSGNIICQPVEDELDCWILSGLAPAPPDDGCPWPYRALTIGPSGPAEPLCAPQPDLAGNPVLDYGSSWTDDRITCSSAETGLSCRNSTGGELELARAGWDTR